MKEWHRKHPEYDRKWRKEHPEQMKIFRDKWKNKYPEKNRQSKKDYENKYPERVKASKNNWYKKHPENNRAKVKRYRERHPEQVKQRIQEWHNKNPDKKREYDYKRRDLSMDITLNEPFSNSHGHHILKDVVMYIPIALHKSIWHNLKKNTNMEKINDKAIEWYVAKYV